MFPRAFFSSLSITSAVWAALSFVPATSLAEDSCVRDSNYATIECLRQKVPALQTRMNLYLEKLRAIYDDPSCQSIEECSAKKEALSLLTRTQEDWQEESLALIREQCVGGEGWEPMHCRLDFKVRKMEARIEELKAQLKSVETGPSLHHSPD